MLTISLCMIVRDEEEVLARCLNSVRGIADEIVVVDTGSTDTTKDIARHYTDHVYDFCWTDDFAAARNFAFSKATQEYILWLDADDVIEDPKSWLELKKTLDPGVDMVLARYDLGFDEEGRANFTNFRERLVKRSRNYRWVGRVHEIIPLSGRTIKSDVSVSHRKLSIKDPDRNLHIFEQMIEQGVPMDLRHRYYYGRELFYHGRYEDAIRVLKNYYEEDGGWVENRIEACQLLARAWRILEEPEKALTALLDSFKLDVPRAEICCDIGEYFMDKRAYYMAAFWYELAAGMNFDPEADGFRRPDCYDYIPYMQLCVLWDRLGDRMKANAYNEKALSIKPHDPAALHNKAYFESL